MNNQEINILENDEYYLFYEMMMLALQSDNVVDSIDKSLFLLKNYLSSNNIILYKKKKDNLYFPLICDLSTNKSFNLISNIVNDASMLVENKELFNIEISLSEDFNNLLLLYLKTNNYDYVLAITNFSKSELNNIMFWKQLKETLRIILKRAESYEKNMSIISTDLLTGLDNRNSYEMLIKDFNELDNDLVYGLFDLFRLKYINDNYSHAIGDIYIKETAKILSKYWPKYLNEDEQRINTGHSLYRIGGDEFALITTREELELSKNKARLAAEEVSMIDLGINEKLPIGLNHGIVLHNSGDFINETYKNADIIMSDDKKKMYLKYNLKRRK